MTETKSYRIRSATTEDAPPIQALHRRSILGLEPGPYSREEIDSWAVELPLKRYLFAMTKEAVIFQVAVDGDGAVVGFCSYKEDEIHGLYVDPDWSRRGIAKTLLELAEGVMREAAVDTALVWASLTAQAFYEAMGYAAIARGELETRGGRAIEIVRMAKTLGPGPSSA